MPQIASPPCPLIAADDVLPTLAQWQREGSRVCLVTVVGIEGAGPRPVGAQMAVAEDGRYAGYLSGGCLEQAVALEAVASIGEGRNRFVRYGKGSPYFDVKLPCGSGLDLYFDQGLAPELLDRLEVLRANRQLIGLRTNLVTGESTLETMLFFQAKSLAPSSNGKTSAPPGGAQVAQIRGPSREIDAATSNRRERPRLTAPGAGALVGDATGMAGIGPEAPRAAYTSHRDGEAFFRAIVPPVRLILAGSGPVVGSIARLVALVGFEIEVLSPDAATLAEIRTACISARGLDQPGLGSIIPPDPCTAVVLAFHEHDWEPPILAEALRSPAFYIGALGNRAVHATRLSALHAQGFTAADVARVNGPIGLIPGAKSRATLGLGIVTEIADRAKALGLVW